MHLQTAVNHRDDFITSYNQYDHIVTKSDVKTSKSPFHEGRPRVKQQHCKKNLLSNVTYSICEQLHFTYR